MGYNTTVTGEIRFDPPLTWAEIKKDKFNLQNHYEVFIDPDKTIRETDEGQETIITADRLLPSWIDGKHYHLEEHVQKFMDLYGTGRTFTGRFECVGEEQPDMWRLEVHDGRVAVTRAVVVWPEDTLGLYDVVRKKNPNADPVVKAVNDFLDWVDTKASEDR